MKKNFKFLSTLALAGLLTTGVLGGATLAATTDNTTTTKPLGIYNKLIPNKQNVVPFVLANADDRVTIKDLKDCNKFGNITEFKGSSLANVTDNTVVCTGDTFKADNKTYTVIIYGDVDQNGIVNTFDAVRIQKYKAEIAGFETLNEDQLEAANVLRADGSGVNTFDAVRIQKYKAEVEGVEVVIDKTPAPEQEEQPAVEYKYEVSVNENNKINADNKTASTVAIQLDKAVEKDTPLKVKVLNAKGEEVVVTGLTDTGVTVPARTTVRVEKTVSFANVAKDGKVTIQVFETVKGKDVMVGSVEADLNTVRPQVAEVKMERETANAKMSFKKMGESDITKMYYIIAPASTTDSDITWDNTKNKFSNDGTEVATKSIAISGSELNNEVITKDNDVKLNNGEAYKVYYILENSYGSKSGTTANVANILSDTVSDQRKTIGSITAPDLSKNPNPVQFTWKKVEDSADDYVVSVYKDGNILSETTINQAGAKDTEVAYDITSALKVDGKYQAGKYKINVVVKGDATAKDSAGTMSSEIEIKNLETPTDVNFKINNSGKAEVSFKDATNKEEDVKGYSIKLYKADNKGVYPETATATIAVDKATAKNGEFKTVIPDANWEANAMYKAEVIAEAKDGQILLVDSKEAKLENFFEVKPTISVADRTDTSITLKLTDIKISGKIPSYSVNLYDVREGDDPREEQYKNERPVNVTNPLPQDEKGNRILVIDGLTAEKNYAFKLVANVDGATGESAYNEASTLKATPEIKDLKVVKTENEAKAGTIFVSGNKAIINGTTINDVTAGYSANLKGMTDVVAKLYAGDVVTIEGTTITLTLPSQTASDAANTKTIDFGTAAKDKTIIINGNNFEKVVNATAGSEPTEVVLNGGAETRFNVAGLNAKKITVNNDITVEGNKEYSIEAGSNNLKINGIRISNKVPTTIKATGKNLQVTTTKEANDLTFENIIASNVTGTDATIVFISEGTLQTPQSGTITIKTNAGKVTVQTNVNVSSAINVEVNAGEVEINNEAFTGNKDISVTNQEKNGTTATVKAISTLTAPEALKGKTVALKEYKTDEEKAELETALGLTGGKVLTDALYKEIQDYINNFQILFGKDATIAVNASDATRITLAINGDINGVTIPYIK